MYNNFRSKEIMLACNYFFDQKKLPTDKELSIDDEMKGVKHFTDSHRQFYLPPNHEIGHQIIEQRHTATKLDAAGLIFEKWEPPHDHGRKKDENYSLEEQRYLLDIQYKKNLKFCPRINCSWPTECLKIIPSLKGLQIHLVILESVVNDKTEELFQNLMALEQCHYPNEAYICNYILLLDSLINSKDDVVLLVNKKIIVNFLGSNNAIAQMINHLRREIVETTSYYTVVVTDLNDYYNSCWNQNMATLRNVYFRDIWRSTATVVGFVVLLITILNFLKNFGFTNT